MLFGKNNVFDLEMDKVPAYEFGGPIVGTKEKMALYRLLNAPAATVSVEDFFPGSDCRWAFHHNEVHLILSGSAEITYTLPPSYNTIRNTVAKKGDVYVILQGSRVTFKVTSDEPYRHFCVIMPRYHYEKWLIEDAVKVS